MSEVKKSINKVQICGSLSELNLCIEEKETDLINFKTNEKKKVTCRVIKKEEFKNPSITLNVNINNEDFVISGDFYETAEFELDDKGKVTTETSPKFKALETIMKYEKGTRVKLDGKLGLNEYATDQGEWKSYPLINIYTCSSSKVSEEDMAEGELSCIIRSIKPEMKTVNDSEEETGRLVVEAYAFTNKGAEPHNFVVEKDLADDFVELYSNGNSVHMLYEISSRTFGAKKPTSSGGGFGKRDTKIVSGYSIQEYSIFRGDSPYEEDNQFFIPLSEMKTAMKAREVMVEQKIKDKKEGKKSNNTVSKGKGLGNKPPKMEVEEEVDDPDCPF